MLIFSSVLSFLCLLLYIRIFFNVFTICWYFPSVLSFLRLASWRLPLFSLTAGSSHWSPSSLNHQHYYQSHSQKSSLSPSSSSPSSIYNRKVLFVCLSRKMITLPNCLKSSSLVVAISFFKHCNKKYSLWIAPASKKNFYFWFFKKIFCKE